VSDIQSEADKLLERLRAAEAALREKQAEAIRAIPVPEPVPDPKPAPTESPTPATVTFRFLGMKTAKDDIAIALDMNRCMAGHEASVGRAMDRIIDSLQDNHALRIVGFQQTDSGPRTQGWPTSGGLRNINAAGAQTQAKSFAQGLTRQFGGSALTADIDVPKTGVGDDIPVTYVPARNLVFLSLTLAWAEAVDAKDIFIGVNALDYSGYPDCRPEFISSFAQLADLATKAGDQDDGAGQHFAINTPLQYLAKAQIAAEAARLGLDPAMSWSCYDPTEEGMACGLCDSCRLRKQGFADAGVRDTTQYAA
jgi:7-cyano-7-deazaguanine synthase